MRKALPVEIRKIRRPATSTAGSPLSRAGSTDETGIHLPSHLGVRTEVRPPPGAAGPGVTTPPPQQEVLPFQ